MPLYVIKDMEVLEQLLEHENYLALMLIPVFVLALLAFFPHGYSYWLNYWWMLPVSVLIALTVNTLGISGAVLFVPFFALVFPVLSQFSAGVESLGPAQAVTIGLVTESFGLMSSALAFLRYGLIDLRLAMKTVMGAAPFVVAGAMLSFVMPEEVFYFVIAAALLVSAYLLLHEERKRSKQEAFGSEEVGEHHGDRDCNVTLEDREGNTYRYCRCGFWKRFTGYGIGGIFQGVAGFGIGEMGIVSMLVTRIPIHVAIGTSHLIVASTAIIASLTHVQNAVAGGHVTPWNIVMMTVPGVIVGGQLAPYVAARLETERLEIVAVAVFVVVAGALVSIGLSGL